MIKLYVHSAIDLITNSSTEIYTESVSIEVIKDFINELISLAGSEKTADDLFEFRIEHERESVEERLYEIFYTDTNEKDYFVKNYLQDHAKLVKQIESQEWLESDQVDELLKIIGHDAIMENYEADYDSIEETRCIISSKATGEDINFTEKILGLLCQTARAEY